jgi:HEAT repeat protein
MGEIMLATRSVDEILDLIESGKPDAMGAGVVALHAKGSDAVAPLIEALKSPATLRRWAAAATLGDLGDRDAVPALRDALSDRSISVRVHAAHSLAKLGANDGIPTLINAVSSEEIIIGHPPELVSDVANQALESVSGRSFGLDSSATPAMRRQIAERWDAWWRESRETPAQD